MLAPDRWCILRTSGPQTLKLADYLDRVGIEAWTPRRTFRRVIHAGRKGERKIEVDAPILPTFVFARGSHLAALAALSADETFPHPAFSIFWHAGRIPLVGDDDVQGLKGEEARAAESIQRQRDADTREEAEAIRIASLKTERERRQALKRAEHERRKALLADAERLRPGDEVDIDDAGALTGLATVLVSSNGKVAVVRIGGSLDMKIEAWRLTPHAV